MKRLSLFLSGILVLVLNGCNNYREIKEGTAELLENNLIYKPQDDEKEINLFIELRDTLIGKFDGKHTDTLIMEPSQPFDELKDETDIYHPHKWHVYTKNGTVKEMEFYSYNAKMKMIAEGDLDGDGKDEWGFIPYYPTSNFGGYHVFRNKKGDWHEMIEPLEIWLPHIDTDEFNLTPEDIVQPSGRKGFLKVKHSEMNEDGTEYIIRDSIGKIIN